MKKSTGTSGGKPKTFRDVLSGQPTAVRALARKLRQLVLNTLPELTEAVYGGAKVRLALYSLANLNNVVCGIAPSAGGCLFYLHHVGPVDSPKLKLEGQGKHARHIKIAVLDKATEKEISRLLVLAHSRSA